MGNELHYYGLRSKHYYRKNKVETRLIENKCLLLDMFNINSRLVRFAMEYFFSFDEFIFAILHVFNKLRCKTFSTKTLFILNLIFPMKLVLWGRMRRKNLNAKNRKQEIVMMIWNNLNLMTIIFHLHSIE